MLNAIFFFSMYPILFLFYFIIKGECKIKRHTLLGIRISKDWLSDEEAGQLSEKYRRRMNRALLIFTLIPLITIPIPYFSIILTIWMVWLLALIAFYMLIIGQGYQELLHLKQERLPALNSDITYTELKGAGTIRTLKGFTFMPETLLCVAMLIFALLWLSNERLIIYSIALSCYALCTPLFYLIARWMDGMRTKVISTDSDVNVNYARASKMLWKSFWGLCIRINTLFSGILFVLVLLGMQSEELAYAFILWGSILYGILTMGCCAYIFHKKVQLEKQYQDKMDLPIADNEQAWIGGIIYYNPKDSHTFVSNKIGMGTTMNMATTPGKVTTLIGLLALLVIPLCCIWAMLEEFTPISLSIQNGSLTAAHWETAYEIPVESIEALTLLDELPKSSRVKGSGLENLYKGTFRISGEGRVEYFLNPQNGIFLRFTSEGTTYYMSGYDDAQTLEIYSALQ